MSDLGLTPEELKRRHNEKTLKEALTFKTSDAVSSKVFKE